MKKSLGELIATIKEKSEPWGCDSAHYLTYKLYRNAGGYLILMRHTWHRRVPFDERLRVYSSPATPIQRQRSESEERLIACDPDRVENALKNLSKAKISMMPESTNALSGFKGATTLTVSSECAQVTYKWLREFPPRGWEPLTEFVKTILAEVEQKVGRQEAVDVRK